MYQCVVKAVYVVRAWNLTFATVILDTSVLIVLFNANVMGTVIVQDLIN